MQKLKDYDGYKITKANKMLSYEYDGACASYEELDKYLSTHTFKQVIEDFAKQFAYLECVEEIY